MAQVTRSIGTGPPTRDFSTWTLWEAADGDGDGLGNDDCLGECFNDSAFDETVTINFSANSIELTAASGEEGDGTAGTGVRNVRTGSFGLVHGVIVKTTKIEIDLNGNGGPALTTAHGNLVKSQLQRVLVHGVESEGNANARLFQCDSPAEILNSIGYNCNQTASFGGNVRRALGVFNGVAGRLVTIYNTTIHDIRTTGAVSAGEANCFDQVDQTGEVCQNNIATDPSASDTGTAACYKRALSSGTEDHNLASDTTASGTGSLDSKPSADQYVSNTRGSEDLTLKSGADAIAAALDLVTTPTGVNIDIRGRDRDAQGDIWDMGAAQTLPPVTAGKRQLITLTGAMG